MFTRLPKSIIVGRAGEQNSRTIELDISCELELWPDAVVSMLYIRPGEDTLNLATITTDGNIVSWVPNAYVTANLGSDGQAQLIFTTPGVIGESENIVGRSIIMRLAVLESIIDEGTEPPDPYYESWLDQLTALAATTTTNAAAAAESAEEAQALTDLRATAHSSETPTAEIIQGEGYRTFSFGLVPGPKGDTGDPTSSTGADIPVSSQDTTKISTVLSNLNNQIVALGPVNNLTSDSTTAALSAAQGKALNTKTEFSIFSGHDMNLIIPVGNHSFLFFTATDIINGPPDSNILFGFTIKFDVNNLTQLAMSANAKTYTRYRSNEIWTPWVQLQVS